MTIRHAEPHPLAGQIITLSDHTAPDGRLVKPVAEYVVEDWWDRVAGMSWMDANGNPAAVLYAMRAGFGGLPTDDEVVYGHIGGYGNLVHVSELPS